MVDVFIGIVPSLIAIRGTTLTTEQAHGNSPVGLSPTCPDGSLAVRTLGVRMTRGARHGILWPHGVLRHPVPSAPVVPATRGCLRQGY
jgi:hypothetical protein